MFSFDGTMAASAKPVPCIDSDGKKCTTYAGLDISQIFVLDLAKALRE